MPDLLLLSNPRAPGMGFLEHATDAIRGVLGGRGHLLFVPFAGSDPDAYTKTMRQALAGLGVLDALRRAVVHDGVPYLGASAGSNLACPSIRTTNDMPIVEVPSLTALGLIPFQLNPHYLDPDPRSTHQGETRQQRIEEFLEENDVPVLGLREGAWLQVSGQRAVLSGASTGRLFRRNGVEVEAFGAQKTPPPIHVRLDFDVPVIIIPQGVPPLLGGLPRL